MRLRGFSSAANGETATAAPAVAKGELVTVLPELPANAGRLYAVFPSSRELPPKLIAFRDAVLAFLEANPLP